MKIDKKNILRNNLLDCAPFENNMPVTLRPRKLERNNVQQNIMAAKANNYTRDRELLIKTDSESEFESDMEEMEPVVVKIEPSNAVQNPFAKTITGNKGIKAVETLGNPRKRQYDENMNALPAVKRRRKSPKVKRKSTKMSKARAQFLKRIAHRKEEEAAFMDLFDEHEIIHFMTVVNFEYQ